MNLKVLRTTVFILFAVYSCKNEDSGRIDRYSLVNRHNITVDNFDPLASLSVGNGNFAFTTDLTGLQTFYREYEDGVSLGTQSNWGWHTFPDTADYDISETYTYYEVEGRSVPYRDQVKTSPRANAASNYFRENPHRLHLGIIRLLILKENGEVIELKDVKNPLHQLDLWRGEITAGFYVDDKPVKVRLFAHQELDMISVKIESSLISEGRLSVEWLFPYANALHTHPGYDFDSPDRHTSNLKKEGNRKVIIQRSLDEANYYTAMQWTGEADMAEKEPHRFILQPGKNADHLEFSCLFSPDPHADELPDFKATLQNNDTHWKDFWQTGGAVDFSACTDPRAYEIERRTILSQYLTKIQGSGDLPPQETGLTFNSWFGKFHLEMIWWHSAHFYNWQRPQLMAGQLQYYHDIAPRAYKTAKLQGYKGLRWPKMVGPDGNDSPSGVGTFLIWQQPHLIYLAEQLYQADKSSEILKKHAGLVFATADFMADIPVYDSVNDVYNLIPPLKPAQEHWNRETATNPPYELNYWHWGLTIAQKWKERMGEPADPTWEHVRTRLATPLALDNLYLGVASAPDSYTNRSNMRDHPMVLGTLGMLPDWDKLDHNILRNTLMFIMDNWNWDNTWGWDYPMTAMCATRLLEPEIALEALLKDTQKNTYLVNGHNYQDARLRIYLPGNGGFLKTIALMCAGWEGCKIKNPGFPKNGKWNVKWEDLNPDF